MLLQYEKEADIKDYVFFYLHVAKETEKKRLPHFHNSAEFMFMLKGECRLQINSEERVLRRGDIGFINNFDVHTYTPSKGAEYYAIVIGSEFLDKAKKYAPLSFSAFPESKEGFDMIVRFLDYAIPLWKNSTTLFKVGFADMFLGLMSAYFPASEKERDKPNSLIVNALTYINECFDEDLSVESVAKKLGYTPNYFSTIFNDFMGVEFREYLNRIRIAKVVELMDKEAGLSICKAAELCGFRSLNTFYRAYSKYKKT